MVAAKSPGSAPTTVDTLTPTFSKIRPFITPRVPPPVSPSPPPSTAAPLPRLVLECSSAARLALDRLELGADRIAQAFEPAARPRSVRRPVDGIISRRYRYSFHAAHTPSPRRRPGPRRPSARLGPGLRRGDGRRRPSGSIGMRFIPRACQIAGAAARAKHGSRFVRTAALRRRGMAVDRWPRAVLAARAGAGGRRSPSRKGQLLRDARPDAAALRQPRHAGTDRLGDSRDRCTAGVLPGR